jgi:release factor glutamine methyltransferase
MGDEAGPEHVATDRVCIGGLAIRRADGVLAPRPWTVLQSEWAAELAASAPDGPILEVCCGAGHIGLVAASLSGRSLVQVDADPAACALARANARAVGLAERVRVHCATIDEICRGGGRFPVVIADPPYVPSSEVARYPEDPPMAIDGGPDGLVLARRCLDLFATVLVPEGRGLLQLGDPDHVDAMAASCPDGLVLIDRRHAGLDRQVALFARGD